MSGRKRSSKNLMLVCTDCPKRSDAEQLHPQLHVPICGACVEALKDADQTLVDGQQQYCTWCGNADDINLLMCDDCVRSFCYDCLARNFGAAEADFVKALKTWSCLVCCPTPRLKQMQVHKSIVYFNIDKAYAAVRPPSVKELENKSDDISKTLSPEERKFAAIFTNSINNVSIHDSELIGKYLTAMDLSVVLRISRGLRNLFQAQTHIIPGLFKTEYGVENKCRLYDHQIVSLNRMTQIENGCTDFGALRGGIFGDEPGLGKTVTTLALVATTAGVLPQKPAAFWNRATINDHWRAKKGQYGTFLGQVLNTMQKCPEMGRFQSAGIRELRVGIEKYCASIEDFEAAVRSMVKREVAAAPGRNKVLDIFRQEMNKVREGLDPSNRKFATSSDPVQQRVRLERGLCPSSATLIVVPLALLEHWYEQIARHLNLHYFTDEEEHRGVVYLDGLGDIVDVQAPLSKVKVDINASMGSAQALSHYLIVLTTFERCAAEVKQRMENGRIAAESCNNVPLLQMRWLRLIVDEGHEIGKSDTDDYSLRVTKFISQIAAERRWVMSGTPTTGANSKIALAQLYRIFQFLRHPRIAASTMRKSQSSKYLEESAALASAAGATAGAGAGMQFEPDEFIGMTAWTNQVVNPCLSQKEEAWNELIALLRKVLLRHTKADIQLFDPVRSYVNLELDADPGARANWTDEQKARAIDMRKAEYIAQTMVAARREWKQFYRQGNGTLAATNEARRRSILSRLHAQRSLDATAATSAASTEAGATTDDEPTGLYWSESPEKPRPMVSSPIVSRSISTSEMTEEERRVFLKGRCPKAIVFSQHDWDLQGVGHHLILSMGPGAICEHFGHYRSSELSRFRHSKRKFRKCPLCGHCNQITTGDCCSNVLLLVEYTNIPDVEVTTQQPGGHGRRNPGGHYTGRCLCSPEGCAPPPGWKESSVRGAVCCGGLPNPFYEGAPAGVEPPPPMSPNFAIISYEHVEGYIPGAHFAMGQPVLVRAQEPCLDAQAAGAEVAEEGDGFGYFTGTAMEPADSALWTGGMLGGHAIVRGWRTCGGKGSTNSWHGGKILKNIPWTVEEEEASVLLLKEDGSTGLDLSFATHIFLLDPIKDPALRNQIVSRAHRMGATGPVQVQLVQVATEIDQ